MRTSTVILGVVLAGQIGGAIVLANRGADYAYVPGTPMLAFDRNSIDTIAIDDSEGKSVTLRKEGDTWILPGLSDYPASEAKVKTLLGRLDELEKGWPVATTSDAAERFKVGEKTHERRIVLSNDGNAEATLLLGTSPAFQRIHARAGEDGDIYSVEFSAYEAGASNEDWMDREQLAIEENDVTRITLHDVTLERKEDKFVVPGLAEGETLKEADVTRLVGAILRPTFETVVGKGEEALGKLEPPEITVTIDLKEGESVTRTWRKEGEGEKYLFGTSGEEHLFRAAETSVDPIVNGTRNALVETKEEKEADAAPADDQVAPSAELPKADPDAAEAKPAAPAPASADAPEPAEAKPAEPAEAAAPETRAPDAAGAEPAAPAAAETPEPATPDAAQAAPTEPAGAETPEPATPEAAATNPAEPAAADAPDASAAPDAADATVPKPEAAETPESAEPVAPE